MDKTFWNIMSIGGLITSCLAGARLYEIGEDSFSMVLFSVSEH